MKKTQRVALSHDEKTQGSTIQELPTGAGKTAKGYTNLRALREHYGDGTYFYITPNKALVDQIKHTYPEFHIVYGRNEYDCLYYEKPHYKADQVPCSLLDNCPNRVDQETGETHEPGADPCPYLQAKYEARQSTLVVCTMSFYLFTTLFSNQWGEIKGVIVDETHQLADVIRNALSYEITDYHLQGIIRFLSDHHITGESEFREFLALMTKAVKKRGRNPNPLLNETEIQEFIQTLGRIKRTALQSELKRVLRLKRIDEQEKLEFVKRLEMIIRDLHRYIGSFEYSIDTETRKALNYTYAYIKPKQDESQRVGYGLNIKCYHVAPVIKKIFPENRTFFMSATIGSIEAFKIETGLAYPFYSHESEFPVVNTRIYLPADAIDLSMAKSKERSKPKILRRIAKACKLFVDRGQRCLMLVVSEEERQQFLRIAASENCNVVTYGNGLTAKMAVQRFKEGEGDVLLGTFAQYGEGVDLPGNVATVTFALRPAYPPPHDPKALFETQRFKNARWVIWNGKEMQRILQARGRNVRSETDKGVTFCISLQYRKIVLKALPKWLLPAYVYKKTFDECVQDALELLGNEKPAAAITKD